MEQDLRERGLELEGKKVTAKVQSRLLEVTDKVLGDKDPAVEEWVAVDDLTNVAPM
jgi:hypothetical protein